MRAVILAALGLALAAGTAHAQVPPRVAARAAGPARPPSCPEGRLADGRCANPAIARIARQQLVCFSQFKLSYVVCPGVLPGLDYRYKYPYTTVTERQREIDILYERQGYQNVFGGRTTVVRTLPITSPLPVTSTAR